MTLLPARRNLGAAITFLALAGVSSIFAVAAGCGGNSNGASPGQSATTNPDGSVNADGSTVDPGQTGPDSGLLPDGAPKTPPVLVNDSNETIMVGGMARSYVLSVPKDYDAAKSYPLVVVLHGDGQDGPFMRGLHPFDTVSGRSAIIAYPSGLGEAWDLDTAYDTNNDMLFIAALIDTLAASKNVDKTHVFGSGFSKGAFFVNKLACRKQALFRGISAMSGGAPIENPAAGTWPSGYTKCSGQTAGLPAIVIHGADDPDHDGELFSATYWAYVNTCTDNTAPGTPAPCVDYQGCPTDKPTKYCAIPGLGHFLWDRALAAEWAFFQGL